MSWSLHPKGVSYPWTLLLLLLLLLLLQELVNMCGGTYSTAEFRHMEVIVLARLGFQLAAPTPAFLLAHMVEVTTCST